MRRMISEKKLNNIISSVIEENTLRKRVRRMVSEEVYRYVRQRLHEADDDESKEYGDDDVEKMNATIRARLSNNPGIKHSTISYKVFPDLPEDEARSWFEKCLDSGNDNAHFTGPQAAKIMQYLNDVGA